MEQLNNVELYQNTDGAEDFMYDTRTLGSAMVVTNTGLEEVRTLLLLLSDIFNVVIAKFPLGLC